MINRRCSPLSFLAFSLLGLLGATGCEDHHDPLGQRESRDTENSVVARILEVTLQEDDTLFVGRPMDFMVSKVDGSFFLADAFSGKIVRFDRTGRPIRSYGKKGGGPGEMMSPNAIVEWEGVLAVGDRGGVLSLFDEESGEFLSQERLNGDFAHARILHGELWLGLHNFQHGTGLAVIPELGAQARYIFSLPAAHMVNEGLRTFNLSAVTTFADSYLAGVSGYDFLWKIDQHGTRLDSIHVPHIRRRGVPNDFPNVIQTLSQVEAIEYISVLYGIQELSNGEIAVLHYDHDVVDYQSFILGGRFYLTLLSRDLGAACVDQLVYEVDEEVDRVRHAWRGDTLFLAYQEVVGDSALTRIDGVIPNTRGCRWMPTE